MQQQSMERMEAQRDGLTELKAEMSATKEAMLTFAQRTQGGVEQMADAAQQMANGAGEIGEAAERMAQGADQVGVAGKDLVGAIDEFKSQFTSVLDDVRKDLGKSIQDMSAQAASTLEKGSAQLSSATHEISTALGVLSEDVNKTMTAVKDSIGQALDIQQRSANEFTLATGNLNESMTATTNIVGELANPIKDGLRSVSDAGQHMRSVGKSLDKSLQAMQDVVTNLELLPGALEPVSELSGHQRKMILMLKPLGDINAGQEQILKEVQGLRTDLRVSTAKPKPHTEQPVAMK
jgi:methyl-accepting chemotaxis protein